MLTPAPRRPRRFVLLDRDGTIIHDRHYLKDPAQVELLPQAAAGLHAMRSLGLGLVLVSNQSGLARGYFGQAALEAVHQRLYQILAAEGLKLDGAFYCPHGPGDACACRKPATGMAQQAAAQLGFDPNRAFVIGDKASDLRLGLALSGQSILVRTGKGRQTEVDLGNGPWLVVDDLKQAARVIAGLLAE